MADAGSKCSVLFFGVNRTGRTLMLLWVRCEGPLAVVLRRPDPPPPPGAEGSGIERMEVGVDDEVPSRPLASAGGTRGG